MDYSWLNIGSILFGLIAVVIPIINLMRQDKSTSKSLGIISGVSISSCAISLGMQILYTNHLVGIQDWSALMDILPTVANVSLALIVATIVLNIIMYKIYNKKISI